MFERFTAQARAVVVGARAEAHRLGQSSVGPEHLLLGVLADRESLAVGVLRDAGVDAGVDVDDLRGAVERQASGTAGSLGEADAAALREIGIDLAAVVARVEESFGPGAMSTPSPLRRRRWGWRGDGGAFSPGAKKVLELSLREAVRLRHRRIGTEHILLGLLRQERGMAAYLLAEAGLDLVDLRHRVETAFQVAI